MQLHSANKYELKDLHQEIGFYDRKIAYCQEHEQFDSEGERASALKKLMTKRESLVKKAAELSKNGIETDPRYLPRSLREAEAASPAKSGA